MTARRAFLRMILGGAAARATGIDKNVMQNMLDKAQYAMDDIPTPTTGQNTDANPPWQRVEQLDLAVGDMFRHRERASMQYVRDYMPQDIASKRSWSPAYKQHLASLEQRELERFVRDLRRDTELRKTVLKALGIEEWLGESKGSLQGAGVSRGYL